MSKGRPSTFAYGGSSSSFSRTNTVSTADCVPIDMRVQFDRIVFGTDGCPRRGYWIQFFKADRNADGSLQTCVCKSNREADPDLHCSYCYGVGHYCTAEWTLTRDEYLGSEGGLGNRDRWSPAGIVESDVKLFFLRYSINPRKDDYIVEVLLNTDGEIVHDSNDQPVFTAFYKPQTIVAKRDNAGRVEYWEVYCLESEAIRPNVYEA